MSRNLQSLIVRFVAYRRGCNIIQYVTNVGRAYAAQDMAYATAVQQGIDIMVTGEPNKRRTKEANWIKDSRHNVGVLFLNKKLGVINHVVGDGHVIIKLKDLELICCYMGDSIITVIFNVLYCFFVLVIN
ncbi:uncharacterized protein LOC130900425 [Diorhabda carinulata]|uniref:uncharacterized protein LOC130900425 n=1 Tax=Diorhabda carinulata TaxID=1163345 RepID=UPI0025A209CE|nr:uncharacterized protein LOC130900425 [Diorhabda carinulata]